MHSKVFTIQLDFLCLYAFTCPSAQPIGELRMKSVGARTSTKATASSFSYERDRADFTVGSRSASAKPSFLQCLSVL